MNARQTALLILNEIENSKSYANLSLKKLLDKAELSEKPLATELVYGVIRYKLTLDYVISQLSKLKENKISVPVKNILRLGIYQIIFLDKIPDSAACNESVKLVYKYSNKGAVGFVNALLRSVSKNKDNIKYSNDKFEYFKYKYSFPDDILKIILRDYQDSAESILQNLNHNKSICVRPNLLKITSNDFESFLTSKEVEYDKDDDCYYIKGSHKLMPYVSDGIFAVQDKASMMCAKLLSPKPNEKVLDLCAAPGGKSCYMASLMENKGEIISCDLHLHRVSLIRKNADALGVKIITEMQNDASLINENFINKFDKVLADVPCSGLGVISGKPDIKWATRNYEKLTNLQETILSNALLYVKDGGYVLYSTCTINKDENERLVKRVLDKKKDFKTLKDIQLIPNDKNDGFYMCLIQRK